MKKKKKKKKKKKTKKKKKKLSTVNFDDASIEDIELSIDAHEQTLTSLQDRMTVIQRELLVLKELKHARNRQQYQ